MHRTEFARILKTDWPTIVAASGCRPEALSALPIGIPRLLGSSAKTAKSRLTRDIETAILYLAPADLSGRNLCAWSTEACRGGCLGHNAGRLAMSGPQRAMLWKTALRFGAPEQFAELLRAELRELARKSLETGTDVAIRLDGTSDLGDDERYAPEFPSLTFYGYTKSHARAFRVLRQNAPNRFATLSWSGRNRAECLEFLKAGGNVAIPFSTGRNEQLPTEWEGFPTIDGDADDYRPADPPGHVVALRWKGPKRTLETALRFGWAQEAPAAR